MRQSNELEMKQYKADLHVHTCLSPCGDLEMSPRNIIGKAKDKGLDIIGITDHNSTRNVKTCFELGKQNNIFVVGGCEINTREEVHCLAFFPNLEILEQFQMFLDNHLPEIPNSTSVFGFQVAVDAYDNILYEENKALIAALDVDIETASETVIGLGGIFIPAHVDKTKNSIFSQLGFIPKNLKYHALELLWRTDKIDFIAKHPDLDNKIYIQNSDAHYLDEIGRAEMVLNLKAPNWESIKKAFKIK